MKFPSEKKIKEMAKKLAKVEGSKGLPKNASVAEKLKYKMCSKFVEYCVVKRITQAELAEELEVSPARVNEIVKYRIEKFTLDRLMSYYEKLFPEAAEEFLLAAGGQ